MNPLSDEQETIVNSIKANDNIIVNAVAGSGKTTTVLGIASQTNKYVIQITYNKDLRQEVLDKVKKHRLHNLEVHTYHSLTLKYYDARCKNDEVMRNVILGDKPVRRAIEPYDVLVVDEAQDMTNLYYRMIIKFINDSPRYPQIVIMGDEYQGIYQFKGADIRFLTLADRIWSCDMQRLTLNTSYRVTNQIASFVNNHMIGEQRISAIKEGCKVTYMRCNVYRDEDHINAIIKSEIDKGLEAEDIFVLAKSLKSDKHPARKLEHYLVSLGIKCYISSAKEQKLGSRVIKGKAVFTTFHQAKGRERKLVIIYGFDESYYRYEDDNHSNTCPSALYVGATRASQRLILLESGAPLRFLKNVGDNDYTDVITLAKPSKTPQMKTDDIYTSPTALVKYLSDDTTNLLLAKVKELIITRESSGHVCDIPCEIVCDDGKVEEICDINGIAIPGLWQQWNIGSSDVYKHIYNASTDRFYLNAIKNAKKYNNFVERYLYMTNVYISVRNNEYYRIAQLDKYNWLTQDMVGKCHANIDMHLTKDLKFEVGVNNKKTPYVWNGYSVIFNGIIDAHNDEMIWELKCVAELTLEHYLQLVIYAFIWIEYYEAKFGKRIFALFNIRTGEVCHLFIDKKAIRDIVDILLDSKYVKKTQQTDDEFINACSASKLVSPVQLDFELDL
jgi:hypothetical protein